MKAQQNTQTSAKEKMLFALLFIIPALVAGLLEILSN